ncbi:hypothetical protein ACIPWE_02175 [Streptomyces sp. NPDC090073]|uniref:hypothetical protein n=1 Tax=Streptomyces sp. NPDC090073 TaxID=3365936 RepID=UPI00380D8C95
MESRTYLQLVRVLLDPDPAVRERAADEVNDCLSAYSPAQASALATLLSAAAASEANTKTLEAQLHAILELMATGHVGPGHVSQLQDIDLAKLPTDIRDYVHDLLES